MAQYSLSFPPGINDVKVVFVVTETMEYGLTRMFQTYSDLHASTQVMVFDTIDKAEKWMMEEGRHVNTLSHLPHLTPIRLRWRVRSNSGTLPKIHSNSPKI